MSETPFIKFYPGDFLGGTSGLTPAERGVYITILCLIWDGDAPVSMDEGRLARRCGMPKAAFLRVLDALIDEGKLVRTPEGLSNDRADKTLMDRRNRTQNATHAANARWSTQTEKTVKKQRPENADAVQAQCAPDAKPEARSQSIGGDDARELVSNDPPPRELLLKAMGVDPSGIIGPSGKMIGRMADMETFHRWQEDLGLTMDDILGVIADVMGRKTDGPPSTFTYFNTPMQRRAGEKNRPALTPIEGGLNERTRESGGQKSGASRAHDNLIAGFARAVSDQS